MNHHIDKVLIDRHAIARRVAELADAIAADFRAIAAPDEPPHVSLVAILTGSLIFLADLIRHMPLMMRLRLITVSSYRGTTTVGGEVQLQSALPDDLAGQHVLVIDDILDSGRTITAVRRLIADRRPASLKTCMLLRKRIPSAMQTHADYIGFDIPDEFVVGYGLDYNGFYRNLPDIVTLKPHIIHSGIAP